MVSHRLHHSSRSLSTQGAPSRPASASRPRAGAAEVSGRPYQSPRQPVEASQQSALHCVVSSSKNPFKPHTEHEDSFLTTGSGFGEGVRVHLPRVLVPHFGKPVAGPLAGREMPMVQQRFFRAGHQDRADTVGHLLVSEEGFLLDVPILLGPAGVGEPCRGRGVTLV